MNSRTGICREVNGTKGRKIVIKRGKVDGREKGRGKQ